jgi:CheY-like chemotaxis protein
LWYNISKETSNNSAKEPSMITKILLVDVSSTDLLIIKNMLSDFTVFTSRNGVEALKAIEENPDIDLVVLDLNMPVMDVTIVDTSSYTS